MIEDGKLKYSRAFHTSSDKKVDVLSAELNRTLLSQKWIKEDINEIVLIGDVDEDQEATRQDYEDTLQCKTVYLENTSS
ncbi:MAG: hypothetical protein V3S49_00540, partial [Thermodesulfobacteriota bacterium]